MIDVLLLLTRAEGGLSIADVTTGLGLSRSTVTAVLGELERAGWVTRGVDRTYAVGPALTDFCGSVLPAATLPEHARTEVEELGERADCSAALSLVSATEMTFLHFNRAQGEIPAGVSVGTRLPLSPPAGIASFSLRSAGEQRAWASRGSDHSPEELLDLLEAVREAGVAVFALGGVDDGDLLDMLAEVVEFTSRNRDHSTLHARIRKILSRLGKQLHDPRTIPEHESLKVSYIVAPVANADGRATHELQLGPLRTVGRDELTTMCAMVRATAHRLTGTLDDTRT